MNIVNNVCIKAGYVEKRDKPPNIVSEYYIGQDMKYTTKYHEFKGVIDEISGSIITLNDNGAITQIDFDKIEPIILNKSDTTLNENYYVTIWEDNFRLVQDNNVFDIGDDVLLTIAHKGLYNEPVIIEHIDPISIDDNNYIKITFSKIGNTDLKYIFKYKGEFMLNRSGTVIVCPDTYVCPTHTYVPK